MRFALLLFFVPLLAYGYESVLAKPETARVVLPLSAEGAEYYGALLGYPHTYEFSIAEEQPFSASVFVYDADTQKNDVSLIVVKHERRGVSEIGRTNIKEVQWQKEYDAVLAESFRHGGKIEANLEAGTYTLEVSSPNNDGVYQLQVGEEKKRGYFEALRMLFEVKKLVSAPLFTYFFSPLIYVPLLLLLVCCAGFFFYRKKAMMHD